MPRASRSVNVARMRMASSERPHLRDIGWRHWTAVGVILVLAALILHANGRVWICACGYVDLFHPSLDAGNSQHLFDWYTPSHIIHGFLFYALGRLVLRGRPPGERLVLAVVIEAGWEILENSPLIIDRYREATMALGYTGDSVINSVSDVAAMTFGFAIARRVPWGVTVALAIGFELLTLAIIRDNLTLNILMLVHPVDAVKAWQSAL